MFYVLMGFRLTVALVFISSGIAKCYSINSTQAMWIALLKRFWPSAIAWAKGASWVLAIGEVIVGATLLFDSVAVYPALIAATALLLAFTAVAAFSARTNFKISCACFGRGVAQLGWRHVWRNLALLTLVSAAMLGASHLPDKSASIGGAGIALFAALVVTILTTFYDDIIDFLNEDH
ncbi:MauE/DoxX family redox-associated membrane protein [Streptomyces sp. NPDC059166]|uniref:MauE/DoxX family redox-associated membrane protein n=1 Tax=Streptomyces sp. NPDC059166 TaxID=3346752 RepID=UPI0036910C92